MIIAGPCLINDNQKEIDNAYKTAEELNKIDPNILFRAKIWGGGLTPEIYFPGIGVGGLKILHEIHNKGIKVGTEIQNDQRLPIVASTCDFMWLAARAMQSYGLLTKIKEFSGNFEHIIIKRHFGVTQEETWGIHDICVERHGFKPIICERGINTFDRFGSQKWIPDFRFMANTLRERPDIELMFDPSHAAGNKHNVIAFTKAALAIGVKHFMFEVYSNEDATQSDKEQALNINEFKMLLREMK